MVRRASTLTGTSSSDLPEPTQAGVVPEAAHAVFGARLDLARKYADLLAGPGVEWGLLGPREADRVWDRHLLNSAAVADVIPQGADLIDVGSGAGLPGIPLLLARPDLSVTLVEPLARRVRFLQLCLDELGLDLTIRQDRAAALHGRLIADVVTARAVAPLHRLVPDCWPLIRPGGLLLAIKGSSALEELERDAAALPRDTHSTAVLRVPSGPTPLATVIRVERREGGSQ